jgi:hypothetical protein
MNNMIDDEVEDFKVDPSITQRIGVMTFMRILGG